MIAELFEIGSDGRAVIGSLTSCVSGGDVGAFPFVAIH